MRIALAQLDSRLGDVAANVPTSAASSRTHTQRGSAAPTREEEEEPPARTRTRGLRTA